MEKIKPENKDEKIVEKEKTIKETKTQDFEALFKRMQEQIDSQAEIIKKQNEVISKFNNNPSDSNAELLTLLRGLTQSNNDIGSVKVIYLEDCGQAMFKLQNGRVIKFRKEGANQSTYGKIVPVSMEDAILLLNEYTSTFERGAIKFDEDHMYMLREKGIDVDSINYNPMDSIVKFEELDNDGIKTLYSSLMAYQKDMLKNHIVRLMTSNKVKDIDSFVDKIKFLNRLTKVDSPDGKTGAYELILEKLREAGIE